MDMKKRTEKANELINTVKLCGRKFFKSSKGNDARFILKENGHIYFIDDYTGHPICIRGEYIISRKFSHGGGLNAFICGLGKYIRKGEPIFSGGFGVHWGYGDDIEMVRKKAIELGIAK